MQEARYEAAMKDLNKAQEQLDDKEKELEAVQAQYDQAMSEKQVSILLSMLDDCFFSRPYWVVRSRLWYDVLSVCRLSVCNVLYCG